MIRRTCFQGYYTSDITRAVQTTHTVLENASRSDGITIHLEPRLREMAKGAREGHPKSLSYEEALSLRRKENNGMGVPLRETEDEAWDRIHAFLQDLMKEYSHYSSDTTDPCCIFIMSHSAILRIFFKRLVGEGYLYQHPSARFDATGRLYIPNTSVTILDVRHRHGEESPHRHQDRASTASTQHEFHVDIIELTYANHLDEANSQTAYAE